MARDSTKVAVVTGANRGIGFEIARGLCEYFNGRVYLTARNEARGHAAVAALNLLGYQPWFHQLDVADEDSVERFRRYLHEKHDGIDVLVNNAAVLYKNSKDNTATQAEHTIRVNFSGVALVTGALWSLLRPGARVVNIVSTMAHLSRINGHESHAKALRVWLASSLLEREHLCRLMGEFVHAVHQGIHRKLGWPDSAYAVSKVGVAALTRVLQREADAEGRDIVINCVHPGLVKTELSGQRGNLTPRQGARLPVQLCMLPQGSTSPRGEFVWCDGSILDWAEGRTPRTSQIGPWHPAVLEWN